MDDCDLLVVGGGPAGLCAAINGASEGLKVCLLDSGPALGGQAKQSNSIENYPLPSGYPDGVTGQELMTGFVAQAMKFHTDIYCPTTAARLARDGDRLLVTTDDYHEYAARAVLLSIGLNYRRHTATGLGPLMGRGVYYGLPSGNNSLHSGKTVGVVGGANSAGQAVLKLALNPKTQVKMFVRGTLDAQMSSYLIDRIRAAENIQVLEHTEVTEVHGVKRLEELRTSTGDCFRIDCLFLFIGATPQTLWLQGAVQMDAKRFILTGDAVTAGHPTLPYETSLPNVFAAGDVHAGSTKRITGAIGEGVAALGSIHRVLSA